ncbi:MAG: type IV pilus twitching motility protein PilT [Oligoflexales bacterium]
MVAIHDLLKVGVQGGASDIILKVGRVPTFRHLGDLVPLTDGNVISSDQMNQWVKTLLNKKLLQKLDEGHDVDMGFQGEVGRFRVNIFRQMGSHSMVIRPIPMSIKTLEELQLPSIISKMAMKQRGLVLVTGATGSGKSTTLAAIVQAVNQHRKAHIITIEDPVEYMFQDQQSTIQQREIPSDAPSFELALKSALRQNPDVIMIGELRDMESARFALLAAETGHLVLTSLHTLDAASTLSRVLNWFPPHHHEMCRTQLANTLQMIVSQRLLEKKNRRGCAVATEVMAINHSIRDYIQIGNFQVLPDVIKEGSHHGMHTFDQSIYQMYEKGIVSREAAMKHATSQENLELMMSHIAG